MGGGLAGMAAAMRLAEGGYRVTLLETRKRLGGRATSHVDPASGEPIDNCQHVLMGCCTNLIDLYDRLGATNSIEWHDTLHFRDREGRDSVLKADRLPAPLHLARAAASFRGLTLREKSSAGRALLAALATSPSGRARWRDISFADWLRDHKQSPAAIERVWETVTISALNAPASAVSAAYALQVILQGFMGHRDAYRVGVPRVPLVALYDALQAILARNGGEVRLGSAVRSIVVGSQTNTIEAVQTSDGSSLSADVYVSAVPADRLAAIAVASPGLNDDRLARLSEFTYSPTIGIHLHYDRRILPHPHIAFIGSPVQWLFDAANGAATTDAPQQLRAVSSAADAWVELPGDEIIRLAQDEIATYLPAAKEAHLLDAKVIKERRATFNPSPGVDHIRPSACVVGNGVRNLFLAGDYCQTGWPATMEGAVRSGYLAAAAITGQKCGVADLPCANRYRAATFTPEMLTA
jgi:zeta-carotene desaturase